MRIAILLFVAAAGFGAAAHAVEQPAGVLERPLDPTQFDQLVELVRTELQPGGRYGLLRPDERDAVEAGLERMQKLLAGHQRVEELGVEERVELVNTQERVNALLTKKDRDRLVCGYQKTLGSHRKHVVCQTYGEVIARRDASQEEQRKFMHREQLCRELTIPGGAANSGNGGVQCR